jgi:murein DD-endopeptidase MepM/ murein hydrolase activator NlpD
MAASIIVGAGLSLFLIDRSSSQDARKVKHLSQVLQKRLAQVRSEKRLRPQVVYFAQDTQQKKFKSYLNYDHNEDITIKIKSLLAGALKTGFLGSKYRKLSVQYGNSNIKSNESIIGKGIGGAEVLCTDKSLRCKIPASAESDYLQFISPHSFSEALNSFIRSLPLGLPVQGKFSSRYGFRSSPFAGDIRLHEGLDIAAPFGSKVRASGKGSVISVRRDSTYGLVVDVSHSPSIVTRYAHLSAVFVKLGTYVHRGDNIGLVGSSGRSTGPHLHYEVLVDGRAKNPERFFLLAKQLRDIIYRNS